MQRLNAAIPSGTFFCLLLEKAYCCDYNWTKQRSQGICCLHNLESESCMDHNVFLCGAKQFTFEVTLLPNTVHKQKNIQMSL